MTADTEVDSPLFTITRSINANVVHYDLRLDSHLNIIVSKPIDVYWLMNAENGQREELTWFEKNNAYGFSLEGDPTSTSLIMKIQAFPKRKIDVTIHDKVPRAEILINGTRQIIQNVFVTLNGGLFPSVKSIELIGKDTVTGEPVKERIEF